MPDIKHWTLVEMVEQWQRCMGPDNDSGCMVTKCPLWRKVVVETGGDVGMVAVEVDITFQGYSLVGTLDELVKAGWSRKPFKEKA